MIHSLIFSPDGVSTAYLYNDIALKFKERGYEVIVLTTTPHYNVVRDQIDKQPLSWKFWGFCKQSDFNGIKVLHVPQKKFKNTLLRLISFAYWHIVTFFIALFISKIHVILSPSPPLTLGLINIWLSKLKRCKVVYNVQEIYPDILNLNDGVVKTSLHKLERYIYNNSTAVTTIDNVFYNEIVGRFNDKNKLHIIPNFVDTDFYRPIADEDISLDKNIFFETDSIKMLYAGNIGFAQEWESLISLANRTKNDPIVYFIIGEGVKKEFVEKKKVELELDNIHILPYQPRDLMPMILAYSDIQFIFMNPETDMQGFPSKVYTIMAASKPLLVCSGERTPIVNFLRQENCANLITTTNRDEQVEEMALWLKSISKKELEELGQNGFKLVRERYSKDIVTQQYVDLITDL